jgi:hypothetical protein
MWSHFAPWQGNGIASPPAAGIIALSDGKGGFLGDSTFSFNTLTKELDVSSLLVSSALPSIVVNDTDGNAGTPSLLLQAGVNSALLSISGGETTLETAGGTFHIGTGDAFGIDFLVNNASIASIDTSGDLALKGAGAYVEFLENGTNDPAAPAANKCRLYVKDDGAGKTNLVALFNTGAAVLVAAQA